MILKDFVIIDKKPILEAIETYNSIVQDIKKSNSQNKDYATFICAMNTVAMLENILKTSFSSEKLASKSYDAGSEHFKNTVSIQDPKDHFLKSNIQL
jgi:hypothetical protein